MNEAQRLASRIAVMQGGRLQQLGTPEELQSQPANEFVRSFFQSETIDYGKISQLTDLLPLSRDEMPELEADAAIADLFPLLGSHPRVRIRGVGEIDGSRVFDYLHSRQR